MAILVVKEEKTRMKMSAAVPSKSSGMYIAKRVVAWMKEVGCALGDMVMKSDQEAAIEAIVKNVGRIRAEQGGGKYHVKASPVASSRSNGSVERAILSVQQMVRTLRSALMRRWGVKVPTKHPVMPWLIEYASFLFNRLEVGKGGRTCYERSRGKAVKVLGFEFGEAVLWKRRKESDWGLGEARQHVGPWRVPGRQGQERGNHHRG